MKPSRRDEILGFPILRSIETRHCRLSVYNLAGEHLAVHFQDAALFPQRACLSGRNAMQSRKLFEAAGWNKLSIRHDAEALEVGGPILSKVDVLEISSP